MRSSFPLRRLGVPTQTNEISESRTAAFGSVVACNRQALWPSATNSGIRASMIGVRPDSIISTFAELTSTPTTRCPIETRQAADTEPTYPNPKMLTDELTLQPLYASPTIVLPEDTAGSQSSMTALT